MQKAIQHFADTTSMHGVPRVINAKNVLPRTFWSVVCLGAAGMFLMQVRKLCYSINDCNDFYQVQRDKSWIANLTFVVQLTILIGLGVLGSPTLLIIDEKEHAIYTFLCANI